MSIVIRRPWTRQPQTPVGVNWGNPLASGLVAAGYGDTRPNDLGGYWEKLVSGSSGDVPVAPTPIGVALSFATNRKVQTPSGMTPPVVNYPFTVLTVALVNSTASTQALYSSGAGTTSNGFELYVGSSGTLGVFAQATSGTATASATGLIVAGRPFVGAGRFASATDRSVWLNGILVAGGTVTSRAPTNSDKAAWGAFIVGASTTEYLNGYIALRLIWNRALSDSEMTRVGQNPWQVLAPITQRIWVPSAASGVPTLSSIAASSITSTGAVLTIN